MLKMAGAIAAHILNAFFADYSFVLMYILVIMFIRAQYRRYSELQSDIYGKPAKSLRQTIEQIILTGLTAGFLTSFLTVAAAITIEADTVRYLFYIMCVLLLFDLRFVRISHAAGILAAAALIFGLPKVNIPSLLCLAAVLQIVESVLIYLNRKGDCIPVFIRHNGEIAGAYLIRRYWLIPVVFLTGLLQPPLISLDFLSGLPRAFQIHSPSDAAYMLGLDCLAGVLCYSDIAIAKHPERKSLQSAAMLFAYGVVLLMLAYLSVTTVWAGFIGTLFCALGHEGILFYSRLLEKRGSPIYSAVRRGLRIMDVLPDSHAELMGLKRGDIILSINNNDIQTDEGVAEALREFPAFTWIDVLGWDGRERTVEYRCYPKGYNTLGIISVPREKEVTYNISSIEHVSILQNIVNRFRGVEKPG